MLKSVTVTVPARLHLGFLDVDGTIGRRFGSLGLALAWPVTKLTLSRAGRADVEGEERERAGAYLTAIQEALGLSGNHKLILETAIPAHSGLGSGTQLALAVAAALRRLHGLRLDVSGDAERLGRGGRSGVGIGLFERGGLVVDGGRSGNSGPAPIVARVPFPDDWRILLVRDVAAGGLHGTAEARAFSDLPPFPASKAAHLCHLVLMRALPGLIERDLESFGAAIRAMQEIIGEHFAPAQGGRFTSAKVERAMQALARAGASGIGQSSWGPTGFAFARSAAEAQQLRDALFTVQRVPGLAVDIVVANNRGAAIVGMEARASASREEPARHAEHP